MKQKEIDFNSQDTVLVITSYPEMDSDEKGSADFNAMAEHAKRRLPYLAKHCKVLVLAEKTSQTKESYTTNNLLIKRMWQKGDLLSLISVASFAIRQKQIKSVFVQFEFNVLGGIIANLFLLLILAGLRLAGKHIVFELHQVILDISKLHKHVPIENIILQKFYNAGLRIYYALLGMIASQIIVFEEELKDRLQQFAPQSKIRLLSLSVDQQETIAIRKAKRKLGIPVNQFVILQFGFINGYKGLDFIIPTIGNANLKNVRFIVAGGRNPYLSGKTFYEKFYRLVKEEIKKYPHIFYTGFIPETKLSLYFSASDLVVLPYEVFMSASGPFSRTQAYKKPVILSNHLYDYAKSADFKGAMKKAKITKKDLFFDLEASSLLALIKKAKENRNYYQKLQMFTSTLAAERSIKTVTASLAKILFDEK